MRGDTRAWLGHCNRPGAENPAEADKAIPEATQQRASEELKRTPLLCGLVETKEKQEDKWLGQMMSSAGLADSVAKKGLTKKVKSEELA